MSGGSLVGLILLSMAWLFFALGLVMNFSVSWRRQQAKEGDRVPSGMPLLPGVIGSLATFFTIPAVARYGIDVPWPWFWILLPLALELLGWFLMPLLSNRRHGSG